MSCVVDSASAWHPDISPSITIARPPLATPYNLEVTQCLPLQLESYIQPLQHPIAPWKAAVFMDVLHFRRNAFAIPDRSWIPFGVVEDLGLHSRALGKTLCKVVSSLPKTRQRSSWALCWWQSRIAVKFHACPPPPFLFLQSHSIRLQVSGHEYGDCHLHSKSTSVFAWRATGNWHGLGI